MYIVKLEMCSFNIDVMLLIVQTGGQFNNEHTDKSNTKYGTCRNFTVEGHENNKISRTFYLESLLIYHTLRFEISKRLNSILTLLFNHLFVLEIWNKCIIKDLLWSQRDHIRICPINSRWFVGLDVSCSNLL